MIQNDLFLNLLINHFFYTGLSLAYLESRLDIHSKNVFVYLSFPICFNSFWSVSSFKGCVCFCGCILTRPTAVFKETISAFYLLLPRQHCCCMEKRPFWQIFIICLPVQSDSNNKWLKHRVHIPDCSSSYRLAGSSLLPRRQHHST